MNASRPSKNPIARQPAHATPASPDDRAAANDVTIRAVRRADLDAVIALDAQTTGIEKRDYWRALYRRYGEATAAERQFLVAVSGKAVVGYVIGEVRDWEFGSPPCGWVFAINVAPALRQSGTAAAARGGLRRVRRHRHEHRAHHARTRRHPDPVLLPQSGDDRRPLHSIGDEPCRLNSTAAGRSRCDEAAAEHAAGTVQPARVRGRSVATSRRPRSRTSTTSRRITWPRCWPSWHAQAWCSRCAELVAAIGSPPMHDGSR